MQDCKIIEEVCEDLDEESLRQHLGRRFELTFVENVTLKMKYSKETIHLQFL